MRLAARLFFFAITFLILCFTAKPSFAQTQNYKPAQAYMFSSNNPDVPANLSTYTQNVLLELSGGLGCQLAGINPVTNDHKCLGYDKTTGKYGYVNYNGGAIGFLTNMISVLYTPPIHTSDYVNHLAKNFGVVKGAYAQGVGMDSLKPISGLFYKFRNITFSIFVIIFIFIGLGIMLRLRIDPRTVMTIQNQIPKVIVGIILITFSFAIAGFMIDLMWVIMIAVINTLMEVHPELANNIGATTYNSTFSLTSIFGGFFGISVDTAGSLGNAISGIFNSNNIGTAISIPTGNQATPTSCWPWDLGCIVQKDIVPSIGEVIGFILGWVVGVFAFFVIVIAIIVSLFKLWFALLKAYIMIIFNIIFAPFWIVAGLIPGVGGKLGFSSWIKDLLGNLMVFPTIIGLFMIAKMIADGITTNKEGFFIPPLLGGPEINIGSIICVGIILSSPKIVDMVKQAFGSSGIGADMGTIGTGQAAAGAFAGAVAGRMYRRDPRTGELRGAVGSRIQRFALKGAAGGNDPRNASRIRRGVGWAFRAPNYAEASGMPYAERTAWEQGIRGATQSSGGTSIGGGVASGRAAGGQAGARVGSKAGPVGTVAGYAAGSVGGAVVGGAKATGAKTLSGAKAVGGKARSIATAPYHAGRSFIERARDAAGQSAPTQQPPTTQDDSGNPPGPTNNDFNDEGSGI